MPHLIVEGGLLEPTQKKELIERLPATAPAIMHVPAEFFVPIKKPPDENIGIGGKPIDEVKATHTRAALAKGAQ